MTLIKLPAHKAGLFISHNEHRNYYESIADYLGRDYVGDFESPESRARCIATDELWENAVHEPQVRQKTPDKNSL